MRRWVIAGLCLALAGCVDTAPRQGAIALDTAAQPGTQEVTAQTAAQIFGQVCADNAPSFAGSPAQLAAPTYKRSRTTGTYFHQTLNLSVKLVDSEAGLVCSVVFGSNDAPNLLVQTLGARAGASSLAMAPPGNTISAPARAGTRIALRSRGVKVNGHLLYNVFLRPGDGSQ